MSKYDELYKYLSSISKKEIILQFYEIEEIIGEKLPESAYKYNAWWSNSTKANQHPYARSWLDAGYKTKDVSVMQEKKKMLFEKE